MLAWLIQDCVYVGKLDQADGDVAQLAGRMSKSGSPGRSSEPGSPSMSRLDTTLQRSDDLSPLIEAAQPCIHHDLQRNRI